MQAFQSTRPRHGVLHANRDNHGILCYSALVAQTDDDDFQFCEETTQQPSIRTTRITHTHTQHTHTYITSTAAAQQMHAIGPYLTARFYTCCKLLTYLLLTVMKSCNPQAI